MIIQDVIGEIVGTLVVGNTATAPTYIHGNPGWQNLLVDEVVNDLVILDEPITSEDVYRQSGLLEENYKLIIYFFTKSELDFTPEQHKPLIAAMREQRRKFINKLPNYLIDGIKGIRGFSNIRTVDLINVFNVNVTGVMVSITITPMNPLSRC